MSAATWTPPDCSLSQALSVWSDLESALHGDNRYGGDTAEIYAYRLMPFSPSAHTRVWDSSKLGAAALEDVERLAARNLYSLLSLFAELRECRIYVGATRDTNGRRLGAWLKRERFSHRLHIRVLA